MRKYVLQLWIKQHCTKQRFQMVWGEKFYRHQKFHLTRPTNVHFSQLAGINCHDVHTNLNYCIHNLFSFIASLIRYFKTGPSNMRYLSGIFRDTWRRQSSYLGRKMLHKVILMKIPYKKLTRCIIESNAAIFQFLIYLFCHFCCCSCEE